MIENPFFAWSLAEAWRAIANAPFLGFIALAIIVVALLRAIGFALQRKL